VHGPRTAKTGSGVALGVFVLSRRSITAVATTAKLQLEPYALVPYELVPPWRRPATASRFFFPSANNSRVVRMAGAIRQHALRQRT